MMIAATSKWTSLSTADRRGSRRYPIQVDVTFKLRHGGKVTRTGTGRTADLSSRGVRIFTDTPIRAGDKVELCIAWPAMLQDEVALNLFVSGQVVRSGPAGSENFAAIAFQRYLFRIRAVRKKPGGDQIQTYTFLA
jgi:hypothetical protein